MFLPRTHALVFQVFEDLGEKLWRLCRWSPVSYRNDQEQNTEEHPLSWMICGDKGHVPGH